MKRFFKIASAVLLLACPSIALKAQTQSTDESWEQAKKQAQTEKKLIFVDLYFTGCMPCAQMDKEVFPDPKVAAILGADFVTFKSDILKEEIGKKLCMKYGVTGFPTFLVMNSEGKIIDVESGFQSVEQLTALLQKSKENAKKGILKKYSAKDEVYPDFYREAYLNGKRNVPFETVDAYLKAQPSLTAEVPFVIITGLRIGRQYDEFYLKNAKQLYKDYGSSSVNMHVFTILQRKKKEFEKTNDLAGFKKLLDEMKPLYSTEEWTKFERILLKDFGVEKVVTKNPNTEKVVK
ncbi:thioredoxin family protein [Flavobacterium branchiicola]|uniref:Thioredoxin family protein n=1 Tax=Flavobacterium branchiicola TaxID=1114875 RepID=A0ABV9PCT7_9FLAO|nr:thioredoxin fold domain-containing protein [Flavobacterium branchiicola]MBS7254576.1 thioredoxin fold domain-containing protein [Flavobacterium branchiicola]